MELPPVRKYPREWHIKDDIWTVKFVRKIEIPTILADEDYVHFGECCPSDLEIRILQGIGRKESFDTLVHEMFHAIEISWDIKIPHSIIYLLEEPMREFLLANF